MQRTDQRQEPAQISFTLSLNLLAITNDYSYDCMRTKPKGGFPVMAETTCKLAASTRWQFFFVASTTASTRCLVQNFQLICYSQRVNATSQYNNMAVRDVQNGRTGWDRCSGETLLAPCTRKKRLQRKITKHYHWIGVQENIGMFSKS